MTTLPIRKVAVLGAGVMGAQIAAHCIDARVSVILFDLPSKDGAKNGIVERAIANLRKLNPAPLGIAAEADLIEAANYDDDLARLAECDLVIEAIAERMDWKHDLYAKVTAHLGVNAIFASNTSGLSITELSKGFDADLQTRFCGVHFFNPPRYMHLAELIPTPATDAAILDRLEAFLTQVLGKGVVRAKDTPNFIANRVGVFSILAVMAEGEKAGLTYDVIDDLTGARLGRAKSATFRTADVVGLDTLAHVIRTMATSLPVETDPFARTYATPPVLEALVAKGALGSKTGAGFYKKVGRDILRLDPASAEYVTGGAKADEIVVRMLKKPAAERFKLLRESGNPQAQFLWAIFRDVWHYAAVHLESIADNARDLDFAIRWGFGWSEGPFETWQAAGWKTIAQWIKEDIDAGRALSTAPLPAWVFEIDGVHGAEGSWSPKARAFAPRIELPVYARQVFRQSLQGEHVPDPASAGTTRFEDDAVRLWTAPGHDDVLVVSFRSKMNTISPAVVAGLRRAVAMAEAGEFAGAVVWQPTSLNGGLFSAGADLQSMMPAFMAGGAKGVEPFEIELQECFLALRYAQVPVVAALSGLALGGGCELAVQCARRVAHFETYIGLVEIGVGLLPGGGGLAYHARRAAELADGQTLLPFLEKRFKAAAMATVSTSALQARELDYLQADDVVVMHPGELLGVAIATARAMALQGYRPPLPRRFPVAGRSALATLRSSLVNLRDGGMISKHDELIASRIADVLCGGDVEAGSLVDERTLLALERKHFVALLGTPKTQERIMGMLSTGKPARN